ncbi:hypothetical protein SDC9_187023 [bioreactor metagenome]|uniref:Uncharacterized protein n=1 Tax=bioreactor metagenome TaxID=1076179 RepID=A0A645HKF2_9ZZZZ
MPAWLASVSMARRCASTRAWSAGGSRCIFALSNATALFNSAQASLSTLRRASSIVLSSEDRPSSRALSSGRAVVAARGLSLAFANAGGTSSTAAGFVCPAVFAAPAAGVFASTTADVSVMAVSTLALSAVPTVAASAGGLSPPEEDPAFGSDSPLLPPLPRLANCPAS